MNPSFYSYDPNTAPRHHHYHQQEQERSNEMYERIKLKESPVNGLSLKVQELEALREKSRRYGILKSNLKPNGDEITDGLNTKQGLPLNIPNHHVKKRALSLKLPLSLVSTTEPQNCDDSLQVTHTHSTRQFINENEVIQSQNGNGEDKERFRRR